MSLYNIRNDLLEVLTGDENGEIDMEKLEALEMSFNNKCKNVALFIQDLEQKEQVVKTEIDRLKERKEALKNKAARLKDLLMFSMEAVHVENLSYDIFDIKLKTNPPKLHIENPDAIDEKYIDKIVAYKVNNKSIKDDLKAGLEVPGAQLKQSQRVEIK